MRTERTFHTGLAAISVEHSNSRPAVHNTVDAIAAKRHISAIRLRRRWVEVEYALKWISGAFSFHEAKRLVNACELRMLVRRAKR